MSENDEIAFYKKTANTPQQFVKQTIIKEAS